MKQNNIASSHYATKYIIEYKPGNTVVGVLHVGGTKINSVISTPLEAMKRYLQLRALIPYLPLTRIF